MFLTVRGGSFITRSVAILFCLWREPKTYASKQLGLPIRVISIIKRLFTNVLHGIQNLRYCGPREDDLRTKPKNTRGRIARVREPSPGGQSKKKTTFRRIVFNAQVFTRIIECSYVFVVGSFVRRFTASLPVVLSIISRLEVYSIVVLLDEPITTGYIFVTGIFRRRIFGQSYRNNVKRGYGQRRTPPYGFERSFYVTLRRVFASHGRFRFSFNHGRRSSCKFPASRI